MGKASSVNKLSPDPERAGSSILDSLAFRTSRNKCLIYNLHSIRYFCYRDEWTKLSNKVRDPFSDRQKKICCLVIKIIHNLKTKSGLGT